MLNQFRNTDLLVLDELGVQFKTEGEQLHLFDIINGRYLDVKPTVLITNLQPSDLRGLLGDRSFDRLLENGGRMFRFEGPSRRGNTGKEQAACVCE